MTLYEQISGPLVADIRSLYKEYNREFFSGLLPEDIIFEVKPLKRMGAFVDVKYKLKQGRVELMPGTMRLVVDSLFQRSEQLLRGIVIHEMIHVEFLINGNVKEHHGARFRARRGDIQQQLIRQRSPVVIPMTEDRTGLQLAPEVKEKPVNVVVLFTAGQPEAYAIVNDKFADMMEHDPESLPQLRVSYDQKYVLYRTADHTWQVKATRIPTGTTRAQRLSLRVLTSADYQRLTAESG